MEDKVFENLLKLEGRLGGRQGLAFVLGTTEYAIKFWHYKRTVTNSYHAKLIFLAPDLFDAKDFIDEDDRSHIQAKAKAAAKYAGGLSR